MRRLGGLGRGVGSGKAEEHGGRELTSDLRGNTKQPADFI